MKSVWVQKAERSFVVFESDPGKDLSKQNIIAITFPQVNIRSITYKFFQMVYLFSI